MVQFEASRLSASFAAIADATRRGVLERLGREDASISALAQDFGMTVTGMRKHVGLLEQAGLVVTEKVGRVRTCRLGAHDLSIEAAWIEGRRRIWESQFAALEGVLEEMITREKLVGK